MNNYPVIVFAPATIANIGPGFDILGLALNQPGDIVIASRKENLGLTFELEDHSGQLSTQTQNVAAHVANIMLETLKPGFGIQLRLKKKMPIGSGLGSSGASSAAAVFAVNALLPEPLSKMELLKFAVEGERLATGSAHADNVAPALLGGLCLIKSYSPLEVIQLPVNNCFTWVVAHPHMVIETASARQLLPDSLPVKLALAQSGHLAGLITGLIQGDPLLVQHSLVDHYAEPVRKTLIPGYDDVKTAALQAGAIGFSISGSGPSVFAITTSTLEANTVGNAIRAAFKHYANLDCDIYLSMINMEGAKIVRNEP